MRRRARAWSVGAVVCTVLAACGDASPQPAAPTSAPTVATSVVADSVEPDSSDLVTDDAELNAVVRELESLEADLDELGVLEELVGVNED